MDERALSAEQMKCAADGHCFGCAPGSLCCLCDGPIPDSATPDHVNRSE